MPDKKSIKKPEREAATQTYKSSSSRGKVWLRELKIQQPRHFIKSTAAHTHTRAQTHTHNTAVRRIRIHRGGNLKKKANIQKNWGPMMKETPRSSTASTVHLWVSSVLDMMQVKPDKRSFVPTLRLLGAKLKQRSEKKKKRKETASAPRTSPFPSFIPSYCDEIGCKKAAGLLFFWSPFS